MTWSVDLCQQEQGVTGITYPSTATNSFSYNAFGARVSKTDSSGTSTYARNGVGVTSPVLSDGSLTFTPGVSSNDGSDSTWSHGDIKNSLRQTGENESTTATTTYDAFGNPTSSTGTWQGPFQYGGNFGYQSDSDSGLRLLGHRYYDSSIGRFLSTDPIGEGLNWHAYCGNDGISYYDDFGEAKKPVNAKDGPLGTKYRPDRSQKPHGNLHIYHSGGESVITHQGGGTSHSQRPTNAEDDQTTTKGVPKDHSRVCESRCQNSSCAFGRG